MFEVYNSTAGILGILPDLMIEPEETKDVTADQWDLAQKSPAVQSWINAGKIVASPKFAPAARRHGQKQKTEPAPPIDAPATDPVALTDLQIVTARAEALGIAVRKNWKIETIRKKIAQIEGAE